MEHCTYAYNERSRDESVWNHLRNNLRPSPCSRWSRHSRSQQSVDVRHTANLDRKRAQRKCHAVKLSSFVGSSSTFSHVSVLGFVESWSFPRSSCRQCCRDSQVDASRKLRRSMIFEVLTLDLEVGPCIHIVVISLLLHYINLGFWRLHNSLSFNAGRIATAYE